MQVTRMTVDASKFANQVSDTQAPALRQVDCHLLPIVEMVGSRVEIIDGYHRIAGMIAAGETQIECITCDDDELLAAAANAERPEDQAEALAAIYEACESA